MEDTQMVEAHIIEVDRGSQLSMSRNLMAPYMLRWDRCQAYVRGDQLLSYQTGRDDLTPVDARKRKGKVVINQTINLYRHVCSRLVTGYPSMAVLPASESVDDILKAEASEEVLRYYWQSANVKNTLRHAIQWLVSCGTVGLRTRYNTKKQCVESECIRPYDLRFEPYANSPDESSWIGVVSYVRMQDIVNSYPDHADEIREHASPAIRYYTYGPRSIPEDRYELTDVYTVDGMHEVWAGGVKVFESPTPGGRMPIQILRYTEVEGYIWGVGLIEPLLDPQDMYNNMRAQIAKNAKLIGNPKVLFHKESAVAASSWTDQTEKVVWEGSIPPGVWSPPSLPEYLVAEPSKILSEMYDIAGIHGTTIGKRTVGLDSGVAVDATEQNDSQQLQLTQEAIEEAVREMAMDALYHMRAFYTESKAIRMLDSSGKLVWSELNATRLADDPEVFLEAGTLFRSEAQDRDNRTLQLLSAGLLDRSQAKRNLSYRLEPLHVIDQINGMKHAKEILEAVKNLGAPVRLWPTDDLDAIERVVKQYMQSPDFYTLDQPYQPNPMDPTKPLTPKQDAVAALYNQVVEMIQANQNPQMAAQMSPPDHQSPQPGATGVGRPPAPREERQVAMDQDRAETAAQRYSGGDEV